MIPISNNPGCHEQAAGEIAKLRRKGVRCHLEELWEKQGNCIEVVTEDDPPAPASASRVLRSAGF